MESGTDLNTIEMKGGSKFTRGATAELDESE
jgi:hypothetical protein